MTLLEVNDLHAGYNREEILSGVSFHADSHTLVGILGANGSGKSTLLKSLCGIIPSSGKIRICGRDARKLSPKEMARLSRYIPQRSGISVDISALDVVLMGFNPQLGLLEYPSRAMRETAAQALRSLGLGDRINDNYQALSEGQKQLCILARTTLLQSGVLFLDEPESALDFSGRYRILKFVRQWLERTEGSAVVTLHDPQLALNTCDTLLLLQQGTLVSVIHPAEDPPAQMEDKLSRIFGKLSVHRLPDRSGQTQIVLISEE